MKGKIKKYEAGITAAPLTFKDKAGAFMDKNTETISQVAGTLKPLLMKKTDPNARPYKNGSKLIKYDEGNKKTKAAKVVKPKKDNQVFSDTGFTQTINMDDLALAALDSQAKQGSEKPNTATNNDNKTSSSSSSSSSKNKRGLTATQQASTSAAVGGLGAGLRQYGKSGSGKARSVAKAAGRTIQFLSPLVSAVESTRKNVDTKTGDINYTGALGQFALDQAAGKTGGASVRIPYKTASRTMKQVDDVMEDLNKRKETLSEYKVNSKTYYSGKKEAKKADAATDVANQEKYKADVAKYEAKLATRKKNKTRGQAPKGPVKPESSKLNQVEFAKKEKPSLQYGERVEVKSVSQLAKEAAKEEIKNPEILKKLKKYSDFINENDEFAKKTAREKEVLIENRKKFKRLENKFGLDQNQFEGQLKKSGLSFEDFYQTKLNEFKNKGQKVTDQRKGKSSNQVKNYPDIGFAKGEGGKSYERNRLTFKNDLETQAKIKRPERAPIAQEKVINKEAAKNQQKLITYKKETDEQKAATIKNFKESRTAPITFKTERTRKPVEDITPTPRKSQLLLTESPVTIQKRADKQAKAKASRESNKLKKEQEASRLKQEAETLAAKQAKQAKAAATKAANKEKKIDEKVKKIKFYGTGK